MAGFAWLSNMRGNTPERVCTPLQLLLSDLLDGGTRIAPVVLIPKKDGFADYFLGKANYYQEPQLDLQFPS